MLVGASVTSVFAIIIALVACIVDGVSAGIFKSFTACSSIPSANYPAIVQAAASAVTTAIIPPSSLFNNYGSSASPGGISASIVTPYTPYTYYNIADMCALNYDVSTADLAKCWCVNPASTFQYQPVVVGGATTYSNFVNGCFQYSIASSSNNCGNVLTTYTQALQSSTAFLAIDLILVFVLSVMLCSTVCCPPPAPLLVSDNNNVQQGQIVYGNKV